MSPAQIVHFAIVPRNVDGDQKGGLAFLATPRADDFQGARYRQTRCHAPRIARARPPEICDRQQAGRASREAIDYISGEAHLRHRLDDAA